MKGFAFPWGGDMRGHVPLPQIVKSAFLLYGTGSRPGLLRKPKIAFFCLSRRVAMRLALLSSFSRLSLSGL